MPSDPDAPGNEPNLELPSFGFGRRKKRGTKSSQDTGEPSPTTPPVAEETPAVEQTAQLPVAPRPPAAPPAPARATGTPPTVPGTTAGPSPARPPARPAARPPSRPSAAAAPAPAPARPPAARPAPARQPATDDAGEASAPESTQAGAWTPPVTPPAPAQPSVAGGEPDGEPFIEPPAVDPLEHAASALDEPLAGGSRRRAGRSSTRARRRAEKKEAKRARKDARRRVDTEPGETEPDETEPIDSLLGEPELAGPEPSELEPAGEEADPAVDVRSDALVARLPAINPLLAAILTGAFSGLATVLLAFGAARGCEAVRGTDSCGGGLGLLAVVAILALEVLIGASLLKAWQIADPTSTSFLGVGLVATIAMLAFLDQINSPWMFLVIPLMTAAAFALSWWVTVKFVDENPMPSEVDAERGEPAVPGRDTARDQDSSA